MTKTISNLSLGFLLLFSGTSTICSEDRVPIEAPAYVSAAALRFDKELGLPFPNLRTLGVRIEEARIDPNPVVLALCAVELRAAENAAGKQSAYDSTELMDAAVDLARSRGDLSELVAMKTVLPDHAEDFNLTIKRVNATDETPRGVSRLVIFGQPVKFRVYANGYFSGFALPERENTFQLGCPHHATTLEVRTLLGEVVYAKRWEAEIVETEIRLGPNDLMP